ncbi:MAG: peptidoglycan DD-metalloendopeptidase family protein [Deltaproteobacteria bacterium]|nr:peptidoglycan DD-metalloendopeptidase family protein [Deltaproteobacteria bacterium]
MRALDLQGYVFAPVIRMPEGYEVYDFTGGYDPGRELASPYGVGRYDEKRRGVYTTELFAGLRDIHVGVDLAAPVGEGVHAFFDGTVHRFGNNPSAGDYGYTLITEHQLGGRPVWALHGHLSARSIEGRFEGQRVSRGEVIAWVGDRHENGGWNPHLHFQLSLVRPEVADLPGAVSDADREAALAIYPDPRLVLGPLY